MTDRPLRISLLALPQSSGSVLYGLYDVLGSIGTVWTEMTGQGDGRPLTEVRIVSTAREPFRAWGGVPVAPDLALAEVTETDVVIVSDLALPLDIDPRGRWPAEAAWLARLHAGGATVGSVCSGALMLAEAGLLDGGEATTHWSYAATLAACYPKVRVRAERLLVPTGPEHRVVTAGGAGSWEDMALYLIGRFCGGEHAIRATKLFLLGDRSDGQLPYAGVVRPPRHDDPLVADCQAWLADNYHLPNPVTALVARAGVPERTFKRRFRAATGQAPLDYVQTLRIEEAKQMLETTDEPVDAVGAAVGYEDPAFFRRLFKRRTGVSPARYRRRFQPLMGGRRRVPAPAG